MCWNDSNIEVEYLWVLNFFAGENGGKVERDKLDSLSVVELRVEFDPVQTQRVQKCTQALHTDQNTDW